MKKMVGSLTFGGDTISYEVVFLASRQTLSIEVHPDCRVLVRAPEGCAESLIAERVQRRAAWISRQLSEFEGYQPRTPARQFLSGETHLYLGRQYRLKVIQGQMAGVKLTRGQLQVSLPGSAEPEQVRRALHRWYLDRAQTVFSEVLDEMAPKVKQATLPRLRVRFMTSRWGSLSPKRTMTLNTQLVRAPRSCIEYVIAHELCHIKHRDHNGQFFRLLGQVMPDWEKRKQRLESFLL